MTTTDQPTGRAARTRARIVGAARTAFAAKGYDATHLVQDVLAPAGVSAGSFYHQFRSKAELYAAVVAESLDGWSSPFQVLAEARDPLALPEVARRSFATVFDQVDGNEELVRIQLRDRDHPDPAVNRPLRALRERWVETLSASYRGLTPDPVAAAELVVALTIGAVVLYLDIPKRRRRAARERLVDNLTTFTMGGLTAFTFRSAAGGGTRSGRGRG